jgi:hypothetical protein
MTEIEYELREKDMIAFNEHLLQKSERIQKTMRRHQAMAPGFFVVIALLLFFYFRDVASAVYTGLIACVWGVGVPLYLKWNMRKQLRKLYSEEDKAQILGTYTLRVEPKALVEIHANGESKLPWREVLRLEMEKKYAFLFLSEDSALIIPRDTIKQGDLREFVKAAVERID